MKIAKYWYKENQLAKDGENNEFNLICWAGSDISEEDAKQKASIKMHNWIERLGKNKQLGEYEYQTGTGFIREQLLEEIYDDNQQLIAAITRNRYGALVLNTDAVVIADVDTPSKTFIEFFINLVKKVDKPAQCLARIQAAHKKYPDLNFIIYQTFAGFRVIITGLSYQDEARTRSLFAALYTDKLYARLCNVQQCFRARLTPKPWRCQSPNPPHRFPYSTDQQSAFNDWLAGYEKNSAKYAVCYKLMQLGKHSIAFDVEKVIARHDDYVLQRGHKPLA